MKDTDPGIEHGTSATAPASQWRLALVRGAWLLLALITVAGTLVSVPDMIRELQVVCSEPNCEEQLPALLPSGVALLERVGLSPGHYAGFMTGLYLLETAISCAVGALIALRSRDPIAFLVSLAIILLGGQSLFGGRNEPGWFLVSATHNYLLFSTLVLAFYLFPSGHFVPRWSRWVAAALLVTEFFYSYFPEAPFSPHNFLPPLETAIWFGAILLIPISQIYRYRTVSTPTERQQTKWVVGGLAVSLGGMLLVIQMNAILPTSLLALARLTANALLTLALLALPISFAIAILRYRLWDIDLIVRRTLIYGLLTSSLALVYFGSVILLQSIFRLLTGQTSQAAIVLSTLVIAALFAPLRQRIQQFIDRRFYRRRYNAQQTLEAFAQAARDAVELERVTTALQEVVEETLQPASVVIWLKPAPQATSASHSSYGE